MKRDKFGAFLGSWAKYQHVIGLLTGGILQHYTTSRRAQSKLEPRSLYREAHLSE